MVRFATFEDLRAERTALAAHGLEYHFSDTLDYLQGMQADPKEAAWAAGMEQAVYGLAEQLRDPREACKPEVARQLMEVFEMVRGIYADGQMEDDPYHDGNSWEGTYRSMGVPLPGEEEHIVDELGHREED